MRNHHFTATELANITTLPAAIAALEAHFGQPIDTRDIAYSMERAAPAVLTLGGKTIEDVARAYKGDWCFCSGPVVFSMPRLIDGYNHAHAPRPLRKSDVYDVHGQSCIYVSRRDDGSLHAVFSG